MFSTVGRKELNVEVDLMYSWDELNSGLVFYH